MAVRIEKWPNAGAPDGHLRVLVVEPDQEAQKGPVLLSLHGAGEASPRGNELPKILLHSAPGFQAILGGLPGVTVVSPQAPDDPGANWNWNWRTYMPDLAEQLAKRYAGRTILATGFSRGGRGVLQLMAAKPGLVSRWAVVDPQPPDAGDEDAKIMAAIDAHPDGWVRYGPRYPAMRAFGDRLRQRLGGHAQFADQDHVPLAIAAHTGDGLGGVGMYEFLQPEQHAAPAAGPRGRRSKGGAAARAAN